MKWEKREKKIPERDTEEKFAIAQKEQKCMVHSKTRTFLLQLTIANTGMYVNGHQESEKGFQGGQVAEIKVLSGWGTLFHPLTVLYHEKAPEAQGLFNL